MKSCLLYTSTREGNDLYYEMTDSGVINKTTMVFGQMNEPPGARMRVGPVSYTHLDVYKRQIQTYVFCMLTMVYINDKME